MKNRLTKADALILQYLLEDPNIKSVLIDNSKKEIYKRVDINKDGSLTLGKTSFKWWNHFINDEKTISFNEFAIKVTDRISGQEKNVNNKILKGLLEVIASKGIKSQDYSYVIDQLLIAVKFGIDGPLKCRCIDLNNSNEDLDEQHSATRIRKTNIKGQSETFPIKFSLNPFGDTIDINAKLVIDEKGYIEER